MASKGQKFRKYDDNIKNVIMESFIIGTLSGLFLWFYLWICKLIGNMGQNRKIGYETSYNLSLFLTPIIGLLITLCSSEKFEEVKDLQEEDSINK